MTYKLPRSNAGGHRAAKIVLDGAYNAQQTQDILNRLDKLEQEQAEDDQH